MKESFCDCFSRRFFRMKKKPKRAPIISTRLPTTAPIITPTLGWFGPGVVDGDVDGAEEWEPSVVGVCGENGVFVALGIFVVALTELEAQGVSGHGTNLCTVVAVSTT